MNLLEVLAADIVKFYYHLDWLSITIPQHLNWRQFLPVEWTLAGRGKHGYQKRYINVLTGAVCETDSPDDTMGTHITLSGAPLAELRALNIMTDDELTKRMWIWDAKCSRIDMAIDCWDVTFTPEKLARAITDGSAKVRARTWRCIDGHKNGIQGSTVDTGSTLSDRRFRCYDKRAEMRIKDGEAWIRLELQLRRLYAKNACAACRENGTEPTIIGHIDNYLRWQNKEYHAALAGGGQAPEKTGRIEANRQRWLKGQVARALASEIAINHEFRAEFDLMVNFWLQKLEPGVK